MGSYRSPACRYLVHQKGRRGGRRSREFSHEMENREDDWIIISPHADISDFDFLGYLPVLHTSLKVG